MRYNQILRRYGGVSDTARALGTSKQTVSQWRLWKRVPTRWQLHVEHDSEGGLKADARAHREAQEIVRYVNGNRR